MEIAGGMSTVVIAGMIPVDISVKTVKGKELIKQVSVKAKFWEYERKESNKGNEWRFKLKIGEFSGKAMARFTQH